MYYLSFSLSISISLSPYLPISLSPNLPISQSPNLPISLSLSLSLYPYLPISLSPPHLAFDELTGDLRRAREVQLRKHLPPELLHTFHVLPARYPYARSVIFAKNKVNL